MFTDASNYAMGACVYLTKRCGNIIESSLVLGKSRLFSQTQISRFSIARKELLGLCMGADLLNQCIMHFTISITEIYVWVDSVTVIKWCQCSCKKLAQFVRNRVDKVMSTTEGRCPGYIQSTVNPADIASRGIGVKQQKEWELWSAGRSFLRQPKEEWKVGLDILKPEVCQEDVNAEKIATTATLCPVITGKTCSLLNALSATSLEAEARLLMLMRCFLAIKNEGLSDPALQPKELLKADARTCLLRMVQNECLGSIITRMQHGDSSFEQILHSFPPSQRPHYLLQLCKFVPFLSSDGVLRIGGRLQNAELSLQFKHSVILPYRHWITELYIQKNIRIWGTWDQMWYLEPFSKT